MTNKEAKRILQFCIPMKTDKQREAINLAIKALEFIAEPVSPATTEVVIYDDFGNELKGFYDKERDMIFTNYGIAPRKWFEAKYTITEVKNEQMDNR